MERLDEGGVGEVAAELVVFTGDEVAVLGGEGFVKFLDEGGFTDAGRAGEEDDFGGAVGDALGTVEEGGLLGGAAVKFVGDVEAVGEILLAEGEGGGELLVLPLLLALVEVVGEAEGGLVPVFGVFGHQFEDDLAEEGGDVVGVVVGRGWLLGDVAVDEGEGVGFGEGEAAGEELVEGDAEGVEIGTVVDGAVHAAGLLGGHVGEGAFEGVGVAERDVLAAELGGDAEID